ncbi:ubiquinone biosynthesis regulatory protein kinase UbiB [Gilvimarinus sp. SDUM040013]|uniref:Probable protein kinase UbiB n=1 Tax=Gilvimarinus gilvus TaxID=3058038 RepID=A0ABU4RV75_9GAMM|nr:ubiquinone biosynthesis regulatory protein kinase UbiB [Gilvimarinus sp. SDUM040013]MDO3387853.1 ubiquinone biosynthesis regulatory protein kinase UbiB [Gilvimarinus sp. SDUM040013]MDX6848776.1 ubiquinone biosynthesis regulatory protein kinase UbiB [Gilvimarinus sp. SDUM040013]
MTSLFRLLKILVTAARYRLDLLLPRHSLPWWLRLLLLPLSLFPQRNYSRGQRLRLAMESLGPIFIKFGQLLSTRPDLIPEDIVTELKALQDRVPPFAKEQFLALVETSHGESVDQIFKHFDREPLASASVAQVHAATLHDGREVVVKVIRPGIARVIEQDTRLLTLMARAVERYSSDGKRLRPVEIVEDYRTTIFDELDLQREAANASQLRRNFLHSPLLYVPEVMWDYCRANVLVLERISGIPVTDLDQLHAQNTNMKKLAERGVEIFFTQVFEHNFFHADMHPGNIFVAREHPDQPQYIAVDMAIVGSLNRADQYYLARNMLAMFRRDYRQVAELHIQSGWVPESTRTEELEAAVRTVCEPIFERPLKDISFGHVLLNLFRTARRFNMEVQPQLVLLQKTLLNIEGLGRQLYPELNLWETAHPFLERWLKQRFHPKSLWTDFKRYGPEWMEKFPEIPHLVFNALQQVQNLDEVRQELSEQRQQHAEQLRKASMRRRLSLAASASFIGAIVCLLPHWAILSASAPMLDLTHIPTTSWALAAIGTILLTLKR